MDYRWSLNEYFVWTVYGNDIIQSDVATNIIISKYANKDDIIKHNNDTLQQDK